jgi:hypothetical protein
MWAEDSKLSYTNRFQSLASDVMPFGSREMPLIGISAVAVHDKGNMLGYGANAKNFE